MRVFCLVLIAGPLLAVSGYAQPPMSRFVAPSSIVVGIGPAGIDVAEGAVWVAYGQNGVARIDARTNEVVARVQVGRDPVGLVIAHNAIWVANRVHMRWLLTPFTLVLAACTTAAPRTDGTSLLAPAGLPREQRGKDVTECAWDARWAAMSGTPLTEEQKAQLQGRSTEMFYVRGRPVISGENTPSMYLTAIPPLGGYGPSEVTDRYVLCFLGRGYTRPNPQSLKEPK
jgi:hypothetical protein